MSRLSAHRPPRRTSSTSSELIRWEQIPAPHSQGVGRHTGGPRSEVQRVYEAMASQGILEHVGEKHLGRFRRAVRYPEKDHAPEAALLQKIQATLSGALSDLPSVCVSPRRPRPVRLIPLWLTPRQPMPRRLLPRSLHSRVPDCKDHSADRPASGRRAVRQALPGKLDRSRASELARDDWPSRAVRRTNFDLIRLAERRSGKPL